jgi:hypothetical protein
MRAGGRRGPGRRDATPSDISGQIRVAGDPGVGSGQYRHQASGIFVEAVERHSADVPVSHLGPLRQQDRLSVTRRGSNADHTANIFASLLNQIGPTHGTWARLRYRQPCFEQLASSSGTAEAAGIEASVMGQNRSHGPGPPKVLPTKRALASIELGRARPCHDTSAKRGQGGLPPRHASCPPKPLVTEATDDVIGTS